MTSTAQPSNYSTRVNLSCQKGHNLLPHSTAYQSICMHLQKCIRQLQGVSAVQHNCEASCSTCRWHTAKLMPGAHRLLWHLHKHSIPVALATSTSRATLGAKMAGHGNLQSIFACVSCGDEVQNGKPAPDSFKEAAKKLGLEPTECLAVEDAPTGVEAAVAAGMRVAVVPSLRDHQAYPKPLPDAPAGVPCSFTLVCDRLCYVCTMSTPGAALGQSYTFRSSGPQCMTHI